MSWHDITHNTQAPAVFRSIGHRHVCTICSGEGKITSWVQFGPMLIAFGGGGIPCPCCGNELVPGFHDYMCPN